MRRTPAIGALWLGRVDGCCLWVSPPGMATLLEGPRTHAEAKEKNVPTFAINVRSYGVQGDAATDDTAAFQRALDDACKSGGGTVYVPP
jgi:hypothetical protein